MTQLRIDLRVLPDNKNICLMCHLSSECNRCCNKCKEGCNSKQKCQLKTSKEDQIERLSTWIHHIQTIPYYKRLYKSLQNN